MIQTLFGLPVYFKFFIGLFALVNPVGIIPVFISMTSRQTTAARNRTNLAADLSVTIILWISLFLGDTILQFFGISTGSFCIAGGILVMTVAMSMVSDRLGEDKQNKREKPEIAVHESIGVASLTLPLMVGPGAISSTTVWGTHYHSISYLFSFLVAIALFALCYWGLFRMAPWLIRVLRQISINVITRVMGLLLMALGIEFTATGIKRAFPDLLN